MRNNMMWFLVTLLLVALSSFDTASGESEVCEGPIDIANYPFHLSFLVQGSFHCSASILSVNHAIIAAHCLNRLPEEFILAVRAGSSNYLSGGSVHEVASYLAHNQGLQYDYDVGILWVAEPFVFGSTIQPVKLPDFGVEISVDSQTTVTTWTQPYEVGADGIAEAMSIPILPMEICEAIYLPHLMTERMYCGGRVDGGNETCQFHPGSAMMVGDTLVGIASFGSSVTRPDYPSSYVKVAAVRDWINAATGV